MSGNRIFRIVGKYFPAQVVRGERLKKYIFHKICSELPVGFTRIFLLITRMSFKLCTSFTQGYSQCLSLQPLVISS
ncbi:hypothetical protein SADUNF_Sadunf16G0037700 [Salix dunnii]|uniref:Uncharacterized protein n=1 Tax=Salix dunnii TaxID=1413687 RepID=A0A835MI69_9ROSI|nr:hypothetical protein SADUNF_Sadunf16G0037700 [Salix dunnii]